MISKEVFCKVLEKKLRKYPEWLRKGLKEDLMADFQKLKTELETEIREI